jgi:glycerol-3-phosphate acyltransferase PlsY
MAVLLIIASYLIGAVPFGLLLVRWTTRKDVRDIGSGRTGATNTMRAAGYLVGAITLLLDALKGAASVWLARWCCPDTSGR